MKSLHEFTTLEEAQAHKEVTETHRVGSGQARGYFAFAGLWKKFKEFQADITHPLYSLSDAIVITASDASSYFGLDPSKADGKANRAGLEILVAENVMTQTQMDEFLSKTKTTTYPYANVTNEEFNLAKMKQSLIGDTDATKIYYNSVESDVNGHLVNVGQFRQLKFATIFDNIPTVDCTVTVTVESEAVGGLAWVEEDQIRIDIKANSTPKWVTITNKYKSRKTRFKAKVDINSPFTIDIQGV